VKTSIIVLAAGASRRMGKPKPLLEFDGETCLSLVLEACFGSCVDETILVLGAQAETVRAEAVKRSMGHPSARLTIVVNEQHERGQTSSLKVGLEAMSGTSDAFILLPVDIPLVTSAEIDALVERSEAKPRGRTIFIASFENQRGHPALFWDSHRIPILEMGDDEPLSSYVSVREGETELVNVDNPGIIAPMNTTQEYRHVLLMRRAREGKGGRRGSRTGGLSP
jgi:molybdenum cofactor cytidylyltransferase